MDLKLGDIARDRISGYEGVVIGVTDWIYGCRRMTLQSKGLHEGKPIEPISVDEPQCDFVDRQPSVAAKSASAAPGGPHTPTTRRSAATR